MSTTKPMRLRFTQWLMATGAITDGDMIRLSDEWQAECKRLLNADPKVFSMNATTWQQFVAKKYPMQAVQYQTYLRLIGGKTLTLSKD